MLSVSSPRIDIITPIFLYYFLDLNMDFLSLVKNVIVLNLWDSSYL